MTTTTPHPADALPLPEPLVLLHTGDDFGGERGDPELEFNSFDAATEYCTQRPPKMEVGLHPDDAIRAAHREGYELAMSKSKAEIASLRFMLAVRVAGAALYGDDGEMQDNSTQPRHD